MSARLLPRAERLYVVRWVRRDGRCVKHRTYTRRYDAERFYRRLRDGGWAVEMFSTPTEWSREEVRSSWRLTS